MLRRRLPGCTCFYSTTSATAAPRYSQPVASTSRSTLDDEPARPSTSFDSLLPEDRRLPLARPALKGPLKRRNRRMIPQRRIPLLSTIPISPPPDPPPRASSSPRSKIAPYLPLVTRERSYLLANLRASLYSPLQDGSYAMNPEETWQALAAVLQYPEVLPSLPPTTHSTITRTLDPTDPESPDEPRTKLQLSVLELRRAFSIFASERPRTRNGLQRLLVVAELLALKSGKSAMDMEGPGGEGDGGRDAAIKELRGGGAGLREKDWRALITFVGAHLRAPGTKPDVESALSLFSQYMRTAEEASSGEEVIAETATYNALLRIASRARSWELVEQVEKRMASLGVEGDAHSVGIRMQRDHLRGAHVETIWQQFEEGLERWGERETKELWGMMLWVYAERGMAEEAQAVYSAMRRGRPVDLAKLRPIDHYSWRHQYSPSSSPRLFQPPPPNVATYTRLIQALAYRGKLKHALLMMRDMVTPSTASTPHLIAYRPSIYVFSCLFRGFATHGHPPFDSQLLSPRLLRGPTIRANARATRETAFAALTKLSDGGRGSSASTVKDNRGLGNGVTESPWNLPTLESIFASFLALTPPHPSTTSATPFGGRRTAPSSKELFWLILAFEVVSGEDSRLVLDVWDAVERKFGRSGTVKGVRSASWTGWRVDKRMREVIERHRMRVAEWDAEEAMELSRGRE